MTANSASVTHPSVTSNAPHLDRCLSATSAFFVLVGSVIGSGIFLVASEIAQVVSMPGAALAVWIAAGLISLAGVLIFSELGAMYPRAGGQYVFLQKAYHPLVSFLFGWAVVLIIQTGSIAAVAMGFSRFLTKFVPLSDFSQKGMASILVILTTALNFRGVRTGAQFLDWITSFKILAILVLVGVCLFGSAPEGQVFSMDLTQGSWSFSVLGVALIASFWAYDGWADLSYVAGEIKNPQKNIPRASFAGIACVTGLYVLANLGYYRVLSSEAIASSSFVAAAAAEGVLGSLGARLLTAVVLISAMGCVNGLILSGARVLYAMGKDGSFPAVCARLNPKSHSPNVALALQGAWSLLLVWSSTYDQLFTYVVFAAFLFYGLTAYAVIKLRRTDPKAARPYRVPLYPVLPLAYLAFTIWFMVNAMIEKPVDSLVGAGILLLGVPFYWFRKNKLKPN